jgi:4'-phosphopantetheinyl transferase
MPGPGAAWDSQGDYLRKDSDVPGPPTVRLWWSFPDLGAVTDERWLAPRELLHLARIRHDHMRRVQALSYAMRREVVGAATGVPVADLAFARHCATCGADDHGRPEVIAPPAAAGYSFSVSHTTRLLGVALSRVPVGLDVEHDRPAVAWTEIAGLAEHPSDRVPGPLQGWTAKEAILKLIGAGLSRPMTDVCVREEGWCLDNEATGAVCWVALPGQALAAIATHKPASVSVERWRPTLRA